MGELSQHIIAKVSGPAWEPLRGQFLHIPPFTAGGFA